jgi:erythromycin esterase-like protein
MAALISELAAHAGDKRIVVWAHNTHVAADPLSEHVPVGAQLKAKFGSRYLAVGVTMGKGSFRAWDNALELGVVAHTIDGPPPATLEAVLAHFITKEYGFVRLSDVPELANWLSLPRRSVENGGVMPYKNVWLLRRHLDSFDVVGFVAEVSPTMPTPTGVRRAEDLPK